MGSVKGLVSYTLVRTADGGFSVTVCKDKAGTDESLQKAKDWMAKNAAGTGVAAPKISEGSVVLHLKWPCLESGAGVCHAPGSCGAAPIPRTVAAN